MFAVSFYVLFNGITGTHACSVEWVIAEHACHMMLED